MISSGYRKLGQAQLKLKLDFDLFFFRFGLSRHGLLNRLFGFVSLIEWIWFGIFCSVYFAHYIDLA